MKKILLLLLTICLPAATSWSTDSQGNDIPDISSVKVLDLQTAQRIALKDNPGIQAAEARIAQAKAGVAQVRAAWWPRLDATGALGRTRLSDTEYSIQQQSALSDRSFDFSTVGLQATWVLFDGFFRSFKVEQMEFNEKSSLAAHQNSQRLLLSAVAKAFLNAQLVLTRIGIAEADKKFYEQQLQDATNRFEIGTASRGPVLNFKVQLNSAMTNLLLNKREYEAAIYGLAALLGLENGTFPETVQLAELKKNCQPIGEGETDIQTMIGDALSIRPDLHFLAMQAQQAETEVGQGKSLYWPTIFLTGSVNGANQTDYTLSSDNLGDSISVNFSWNLYSGGERRAKIAAAEQKKREMNFSMADLRNQVVSEIRQEVALVAAAREQVELQQESVVLVEENRQLAQNEYDAGTASLVRLNEAQRDLTSTYGRLAQALVSYQLARQRLFSATGQNLRLVNQKE